MAENHEITLIDVLEWMGGRIRALFTSLFDAVGWSFRFTYRHKWLILPLVLLGIAYGLYKSFPKVYRAETTLHTIYIPASTLHDQMMPLDRSAFRAHDSLHTQLGLPPTYAKALRTIKSYTVIGDLKTGDAVSVEYQPQTVNPKTEFRMPDRLRVAIEMSADDFSHFDTVARALERYLGDLPSNRAERALREQNARALLAQISAEIDKVDSISRLTLYNPSAVAPSELKIDSSGFSLGRKSTLYSEEIFELRHLRDSVSLIVDSPSILVDTPPLIKRFPTNFWMKNVLIYGVLFYILALIITVPFAYRNAILRYLRS